MASKSKVSVKQVAAVIPALKPKRRPRGNSPFVKGNTYGFKKGQSGNPGGKPKVFVKFAAKVAEEMLQPVPKEIKAALGLPRGATMYDAMVRALLLQAANGDTMAFTTARESVEGKLAQRNINISASLQALQDDPQFVEWLEANHQQYLTVKGESNGNGQRTIDEVTRYLQGPADAKDISGN